MNVDPGYECIKKFKGNIQWYLMQSKDFKSQVSSLNLKMQAINWYPLAVKVCLFVYQSRKLNT